MCIGDYKTSSGFFGIRREIFIYAGKYKLRATGSKVISEGACNFFARAGKQIIFAPLSGESALRERRRRKKKINEIEHYSIIIIIMAN